MQQNRHLMHWWSSTLEKKLISCKHSKWKKKKFYVVPFIEYVVLMSCKFYSITYRTDNISYPFVNWNACRKVEEYSNILLNVKNILRSKPLKKVKMANFILKTVTLLFLVHNCHCPIGVWRIHSLTHLLTDCWIFTTLHVQQHTNRNRSNRNCIDNCKANPTYLNRHTIKFIIFFWFFFFQCFKWVKYYRYRCKQTEKKNQ